VVKTVVIRVFEPLPLAIMLKFGKQGR